MREMKRALVVDEDLERRLELARSLEARWSLTTRTEGKADLAAADLADWMPDLLLLSFPEPRGSAVRLARAAFQLRPAPLVIAFGEASGAEAFEMGAAGVSEFLPCPFDLSRVSEAIQRGLTTPPDLAPFLRRAVPHRGLLSVVGQVRHEMILEALSLAGWRKRGAARLLGVTRQAIQQATRSLPCDEAMDAGAAGTQDVALRRSA